MISTPGMEILRDGEYLVGSTSDSGIPVTLQNCFFPAVCSEKFFPTPLYVLRTGKALEDRGQCLNIVLNNLTCDQGFFPFLRAGEARGKKLLP